MTYLPMQPRSEPGLERRAPVRLERPIRAKSAPLNLRSICPIASLIEPVPNFEYVIEIILPDIEYIKCAPSGGVRQT
jgi:hypothetical protein